MGKSQFVELPVHKLSILKIPVLVENGRHCNNDCPQMRTWDLPTATGDDNLYPYAHCIVFDQPLRWDRSRRWNGYLRCQACRNARSTP